MNHTGGGNTFGSGAEAGYHDVSGGPGEMGNTGGSGGGEMGANGGGEMGGHGGGGGMEGGLNGNHTGYNHCGDLERGLEAPSGGPGEMPAVPPGGGPDVGGFVATGGAYLFVPVAGRRKKRDEEEGMI